MPSDGNPSFYHLWAVMDFHPKSLVMDIHAPSRLNRGTTKLHIGFNALLDISHPFWTLDINCHHIQAAALYWSLIKISLYCRILNIQDCPKRISPARSEQLNSLHGHISAYHQHNPSPTLPGFILRYNPMFPTLLHNWYGYECVLGSCGWHPEDRRLGWK